MRVAPSHWTFAAILLLVGAKLVVDPEGFSTLGQGLSQGIRNELRSCGMDHWRLRLRDHCRTEEKSSKTVGRVAGFILIAIGLLIAAVS